MKIKCAIHKTDMVLITEWADESWEQTSIYECSKCRLNYNKVMAGQTSTHIWKRAKEDLLKWG
jgi:hypothetical protein